MTISIAKRMVSLLLVFTIFVMGTGVTVEAGTVGRLETISADEHNPMAIKNDGSLWVLEWEQQQIKASSGTTGTTFEMDGLIVYNEGIIGLMTVNGEEIPFESINSSVRKRKSVRVMSGVRSVAQSVGLNVAIKTDGSLWVWSHRAALSKIMDDVAVASGNYVIMDDGSLWKWFYVWPTNLPDNPSKKHQVDPNSIVTEKIMDDVVVVADGFSHAMAIKTDGSLWVWGGNQNGELGVETERTFDNDPVKVMDNVVSIAAGWYHSLAVTEDGDLWAWGKNDRGQLGDGTTKDRHTPVKIMDKVVTVAAGSSHSMALKTNGSLWGWGANTGGMFGSTMNQSKPIKVMDSVAAVSAGFMSTIAVKKDKSLWEWDYSNKAQKVMTNVMPYGVPSVSEEK